MKYKPRKWKRPTKLLNLQAAIRLLNIKPEHLETDTHNEIVSFENEVIELFKKRFRKEKYGKT